MAVRSARPGTGDLVLGGDAAELAEAACAAECLHPLCMEQRESSVRVQRESNL